MVKNKCLIHKQLVAYGDVKLVAGGAWDSTTICGSRGRAMYYYRWSKYTFGSLGGRFCSEGKK